MVESYEYVFCGRSRAVFSIAEIDGEVKVRIVEESGVPVVNLVPSKFLPRFPTLEQARDELAQLAGRDAKLLRR